MKILIFLFTFLMLVPVVYAGETYFDFSSSQLLDTSGSIDVELKYKLVGAPESRFRIMPRADVPIKLEFFGWNEAPILEREVSVTFLGSDFNETFLWFEILDVKTAKVYKTPKKVVRSKRWFYEYLSLIKYSNEDD